MKKIAFAESTAAANLKKITDVLHQIGRESWKSVPLDKMFDAIKAQGLLPIQEDGEEWSGILTGREGGCSIQIVDSETKKPIRPWLHIQWYKRESGLFEVNAYLN